LISCITLESFERIGAHLCVAEQTCRGFIWFPSYRWKYLRGLVPTFVKQNKRDEDVFDFLLTAGNIWED
jgi:hypothetical protein